MILSFRLLCAKPVSIDGFLALLVPCSCFVLNDIAMKRVISSMNGACAGRDDESKVRRPWGGERSSPTFVVAAWIRGLAGAMTAWSFPKFRKVQPIAAPIWALRRAERAQRASPWPRPQAGPPQHLSTE